MITKNVKLRGFCMSLYSGRLWICFLQMVSAACVKAGLPVLTNNQGFFYQRVTAFAPLLTSVWVIARSSFRLETFWIGIVLAWADFGTRIGQIFDLASYFGAGCVELCSWRPERWASYGLFWKVSSARVIAWAQGEIRRRLAAASACTSSY